MQSVRTVLAPNGVLRAGINLSNFLLVSSRGPNGEPQGVAPDMAHALGERLEVQVELVPYPNPGVLADAVDGDEFDVCFIGAEKKRAETIAFTAPYVEIHATYLVPPGSTLTTIDEVDTGGKKIAVSARSAYDLWLTSNLKHAALVRTEDPGLDLSLELYRSGNFDALAGLRPWLTTKALDTFPGSRVLNGHFTTVQQAIGSPRARGDGGASLFLERFVEESKASGLVQSLLEKHGVVGKLSVAP